jgi:hypothetical protein
MTFHCSSTKNWSSPNELSSNQAQVIGHQANKGEWSWRSGRMAALPLLGRAQQLTDAEDMSGRHRAQHCVQADHREHPELSVQSIEQKCSVDH